MLPLRKRMACNSSHASPPPLTAATRYSPIQVWSLLLLLLQSTPTVRHTPHYTSDNAHVHVRSLISHIDFICIALVNTSFLFLNSWKTAVVCKMCKIYTCWNYQMTWKNLRNKGLNMGSVQEIIYNGTNIYKLIKHIPNIFQTYY